MLGAKELNKVRDVTVTISLVISFTIHVVTATTPVPPPLEVKLHLV